MKISLKWLNEYVDISDYFAKPEELAKILTQSGLEVDAVEDLAKNFAHVVVGQVDVLGRHPDADRLTLCQVNVGEKQQRQIICGAQNHKQGDKVVAALPGAVLPGNFEIKLSKIRGVESHGMLCSDSELGFSKESEGIRILPKDAKVGQFFAEYAGLNDITLEVNVTPNRADCLSHIGLAREISCLLNRKLKMPAAKIKTTKHSTKKNIKVDLIASEACPRYAGQLVRNVTVAPSPDWLRQRLESVGMNSINNIVDITNFVMLEYGQPLHAFDLAQIGDAQIIIDYSKGEKFTSLDGTEYKLSDQDLTIRDGKRAVALAGVVGGLNSGVTDKTKDIFLEAAHFAPDAVRKSSRRLGIDTDSAYRFSRGTNAEGVVDAMERAAYLMQEIAGGEVAADAIDQYPKKWKRKAIKVRRSTLEDRLAYPVKLKDFAEWMKRLHCKVRVNPKDCSVETPPFRWDLEQEMDLVEEYARLEGYDKISENFPPLLESPTNHSDAYIQRRRIVDILTAEGFLQSMNHNFLSEAWQNSIYDFNMWKNAGLTLPDVTVKIMNPLSEETAVMRKSVLPSLLKNLVDNISFGTQSGQIFEVGSVFAKDNDAYAEQTRIGLVLWGESKDLWTKSTSAAVYSLKSRMENLLTRLQSQGHQWRDYDAGTKGVAHPGQTASLFYQGKNIGFVGSLHPAFKDKHKIRFDVAVAEFDLSLLMRGQPKQPKVSSISKYPSVERDFSLVVPKTIQAQDLLSLIKKSAGSDLVSVNIFDRFEGGNLQADQVSLGFRLKFQSKDKTLSDTEVQAASDQVLSSLKAKHLVELR